MAGIDVLASFGIGAAELDAYERADPPRPARGSLGRRAKDRAAKSCRLRPQAGICDPCIDAPGFGRLSNSLPEGFNDKAKTLKKAVAAYPTSSASGSGHSSSSAKATPGNEGDSKNRQTPGKVGEPRIRPRLGQCLDGKVVLIIRRSPSNLRGSGEETVR